MNTSFDVERQVRDDMLNKFTRKLINSGFSQEEAQRFLVMSVTNYVYKVSVSELPVDHVDYKPLHLSKEYLREERLLAKAEAKASWFKKSQNGKTAGDRRNNTGQQSRSWKALIPHEWKGKVTRQRDIPGINISTVKVVSNT